MWRHSGTPDEARVFAAQVRDYNASHPHVHVRVRTIPEGDYNDELQAAVASRTVPDIAEVDGPLVDSYVYQDQLAVLDDLMPPEVLRSQLPSLRTQGMVDGHSYAVGVFDSGLGLCADRQQLRAAGITSWPTKPGDSWTADEFADTLAALASWVGHWVYNDYAQALGDDLVVLPLPDLGRGTKSGEGSWTWGIRKDAPSPEAAASFLTFLLRTDQVLRMTAANAAVPGTRAALARSPLYGASAPLHLFAEQLLDTCGDRAPTRSCVAVPRPATPAYPTLSAQFSHAVHVALTGGDWERALTAGAKAIDADRKANNGYR